jgi:DNA polymerase III subunit epsilon
MAPGFLERYRRIIVLDTETKGVQRYDKIVSLGAVSIENGALLTRRAMHLVFDPRKDSDPAALAIHGWDNWALRHQDLFASLAPGIHRWLSWAELIVCHNADFDMHYLQRDFRKSEHPQLDVEVFCTMKAARSHWPQQSARLDDVLARIGLGRNGRLHGALEDALLTAGVFIFMQTGNPGIPG